MCDDVFSDESLSLLTPEQLRDLWDFMERDFEIKREMAKPYLAQFDGGTCLRIPFTYSKD